MPSGSHPAWLPFPGELAKWVLDQDPLWFPPMLLGKIFICSADHASAPSYQIQGTFLTLLGHQIQILQPRLGRGQLFYGNLPVIFSGLCLISSHLLCSPLCDKMSAGLPGHRYEPAMRSA